MTDPRMAAEASFARSVFQALKTWLAKVRTAVMAAWKRFRAQPNPTAVAQETPLWLRLVAGLKKELHSAADIGHAEVSASTRRLDEQFVQQSLDITLKFLAGIPDEVTALVAQDIHDAVAAGNTPDQIAARIDALLDATGSPRWKNRADTIAATEVHWMANAAVQAAASQVERLEGVQMEKTWVTRHDERVRQAHVEADGQTVPLASTFLVDGVPMVAPGDNTAPARLRVHCRCSMKVKDVKK